MPEARTVSGAAGGAAITLLADPVYQVCLAIATWNWTPEAQEALAKVLAAILMSALGVLAMARDRIVGAIEDGKLEDLQAGLVERAATRFGIRVERKIPRVTPEAEGTIPPLDREGEQQ